MKKGTDHIIYTAEDIANYHHGKLSASEMHTIEKAALDDPFLADAIEGYEAHTATATSNSKHLQGLLEKRTKRSDARIISFGWMRVAAIVVFVLGAGLIIFQIASVRRDDEQIAMKAPSPALIEKQQNAATAPSYQADSAYLDQNSVDLVFDDKAQRVEKKKSTNDLTKARETEVADAAMAVIPEPAPSGQLLERAVANEDSVATVVVGYGTAKPNTNKSFRGYVQNEQNQKLPFAHIENLDAKASTYSDVNGFFELKSTDTLLRLMVRSKGYEPKVMQLKDTRSANLITMESNKNELSEVVVVQKNASAAQATDNNFIPKDGWEKYRTYLINNIQIDNLTRSNNPGEVTLGFDLNKSGSPANITIIKSLCAACDKEAIRLLKEGPKWKKPSSANKGVLTILF